jgi:hypothetical protein
VASGKEIEPVTNAVGSKPAFTSCNFQKARSISPLPINKTKAKANSLTTSVCRNRCVGAEPVLEAAQDFNDS